MSSPATLPTDSPDALELVDVDDVWDLAVGDQVVVEFSRYFRRIRSHTLTLTGSVREVRGTRGAPDHARFADGTGDLYRVTPGGSVYRVRDERPNVAIGRAADVQVIREIAPDGGRATDDDGSPLEFPDLEERFGTAIVSTAAHVLDRDLLQSGEVKDELIVARIRGIDTPEELAAYRAIETRTRNRDRVHDLLTERAEYLAEHGYRPDDLVAALLDQDEEVPDRYRLRVPLWVSTHDLQERPDVDHVTERAASAPSRSRQGTTSSSSSTTTQVTLAADGGDRP